MNPRICLVAFSNSLVLREYVAALSDSNISVYLLLLPPNIKMQNLEESRTNGLWKPPPIEFFSNIVDIKQCGSLLDPSITFWLKKHCIDVLIQSCFGIVKGPILDSHIWINIHPGSLPGYRGSCAPEWQILENKPIISTAHLMTSHIDAGYIISKHQLAFPRCNSLAQLRSHLYSRQSIFLAALMLSINIDDLSIHSDHDISGFLDYPLRSVPNKDQFKLVDSLVQEWTTCYALS